MTRELRSWRWMIVFAFGLVHGLGFAGALKDLHLPTTGILKPLIAFNLGVELGQLTVNEAAEAIDGRSAFLPYGHHRPILAMDPAQAAFAPNELLRDRTPASPVRPRARPPARQADLVRPPVGRRSMHQPPRSALGRGFRPSTLASPVRTADLPQP
ncbi:MAG: HupE/UreJ family protein [Planctomycetes bacterium]|nr:HupE/UreJ family protein [Planctomycetota bacterium]